LKTGTIDGQDNPLPTVKSAKVLRGDAADRAHGHLVDRAAARDLLEDLARAIRGTQGPDEKGGGEGGEIQRRKPRARERELIEFFRAKGIEITVPTWRVQEDRAGRVSEVEYAEKWPRGLSSASMRSGRGQTTFSGKTWSVPGFLGHWADLTGAGIFAVLFLALVLQVVRRFVFGAPAAWTEELATIAFVWVIFWGLRSPCRSRLTWPWTSSRRASRPASSVRFTRWALPRSGPRFSGRCPASPITCAS